MWTRSSRVSPWLTRTKMRSQSVVMKVSKFFCRSLPSEPTLQWNWMLVGVQTAPVSGGHLELDMSINNVNQIYWYLTQVSIIYICQAVVELVVTRLQLTRRVLGRQKQTRRGRWRSWGLSVVSAGGGEAGGEDGVAELQLWSRHQARGAARHHCRVNQNNAAAANAK